MHVSQMESILTTGWLPVPVCPTLQGQSPHLCVTTVSDSQIQVTFAPIPAVFMYVNGNSETSAPADPK